MKIRSARLLLAAAAALVATPADGQVVSVSPHRGWIGISVEARTTVQGDAMSTRVTITDVDPDSPAWASGVRPGDVLVSINGRPYEQGFTQLARSLEPGDEVSMEITRDGRPHEVHLTAAARPVEHVAPQRWTVELRTDTVVERMFQAMDSLRVRLVREGPAAVAITTGAGRPVVAFRPDTLEGHVIVAPGEVRAFRFPEFPEGAERDLSADEWEPFNVFLQRADTFAFRPLDLYALGRNRAAGAEVVDLQPELADYFGVSGGVLVVDVAPGTPAARAGLLPGDVITRLGDAEVASIGDLRLRLVQQADSLAMRVIRKGSTVEVLLRR